MTMPFAQGSQATPNVPVNRRDTGQGSMKIPPALSLGGVTTHAIDDDIPLSYSSLLIPEISPRSSTFENATPDDSRRFNTPSQFTRPLSVYSIAELIILSQSPFVSIPQEKRDEIRKNAPEIYMNRKQRQARVARAVQANNVNGNGIDIGKTASGQAYLVSSAFLQYPQKLKRQAHWQEKREQKDHGATHVTLTPKSDVSQDTTFTHPLPLKPVVLPVSVKSAPPTQVSFMAPRSQEPQSPSPQRRLRRSMERRRNSKTIVNEMSWRTGIRGGVRQRTWSAQGTVLPTQ